MIEDFVITFNHLNLNVFIGKKSREMFKDYIFEKVLEFEENVALINDFDDRNEYFRLFCLVENRRNEMCENIKGFDFAFWIKEYESCI